MSDAPAGMSSIQSFSWHFVHFLSNRLEARSWFKMKKRITMEKWAENR